MLANHKQITKAGQRLTITYEDREFDVIVIDPHGLGYNQPSIGFGFRMAEKYMGIPHNTLSDWMDEESVLEGGRNNDVYELETPAGKTFRVVEISGEDENYYVVIEASDWVNLAKDVIKYPGKLRKKTKNLLIDFLAWFAIKGFYAEAYTALKGTYTVADSQALTTWIQARLNGVSIRNAYTRFLCTIGVNEGYEMAYWTNYVYKGLFGITKKQMIEQWEYQQGDRTIGRNYIPSEDGLKAIAYAEKMVEEIYLDDIKSAHDYAIALTKKKFKLK